MHLLLPKGYLSHSQCEIWRTNRARYRAEYFEGKRKLDSKYLRFGKSHAENREKRGLLPGQFTEYEIFTTVKGVPILAYLDFYDSNENYFSDDKTGKHPWTQTRIQQSEQMLFYATALKHHVGETPGYCLVNWFETRDEKQEGTDFWREGESIVTFTGKELTFRRDFDEREIERMEYDILRIATEISSAYKLFIDEL